MLACYQQLLHGDQLRLELVGEFFEVLGVLLPSLGVECNFLFTQPRFHKFIFMKGNTTKRVQALFLIFFSLFSAFVTLLYDPPLRNYSKAEIMQAREKMQATRESQQKEAEFSQANGSSGESQRHSGWPSLEELFEEVNNNEVIESPDDEMEESPPLSEEGALKFFYEEGELAAETTEEEITPEYYEEVITYYEETMFQDWDESNQRNAEGQQCSAAQQQCNVAFHQKEENTCTLDPLSIFDPRLTRALERADQTIAEYYELMEEEEEGLPEWAWGYSEEQGEAKAGEEEEEYSLVMNEEKDEERIDAEEDGQALEQLQENEYQEGQSRAGSVEADQLEGCAEEKIENSKSDEEAGTLFRQEEAVLAQGEILEVPSIAMLARDSIGDSYRSDQGLYSNYSNYGQYDYHQFNDLQPKDQQEDDRENQLWYTNDNYMEYQPSVDDKLFKNDSEPNSDFQTIGGLVLEMPLNYELKERSFKNAQHAQSVQGECLLWEHFFLFDFHQKDSSQADKIRRQQIIDEELNHLISQLDSSSNKVEDVRLDRTSSPGVSSVKLYLIYFYVCYHKQDDVLVYSSLSQSQKLTDQSDKQIDEIQLSELSAQIDIRARKIDTQNQVEKVDENLVINSGATPVADEKPAQLTLPEDEARLGFQQLPKSHSERMPFQDFPPSFSYLQDLAFQIPIALACLYCLYQLLLQQQPTPLALQSPFSFQLTQLQELNLLFEQCLQCQRDYMQGIVQSQQHILTQVEASFQSV